MPYHNNVPRQEHEWLITVSRTTGGIHSRSRVCIKLDPGSQIHFLCTRARVRAQKVCTSPDSFSVFELSDSILNNLGVPEGGPAVMPRLLEKLVPAPGRFHRVRTGGGRVQARVEMRCARMDIGGDPCQHILKTCPRVP